MAQSKPIVIAICGGSGSGKTTLAKALIKQFGDEQCCLLAQDNYYKDQRDCFDEDGGSVNFDHPSSIDFDLFVEHLKYLMRAQSAPVPIYHFHDHSRSEEVVWLAPRPVILIDGTLILTRPQVRELVDTSIFLDIPETVRFERRLFRDVRERGRKTEGVYKQFFTQVKPMHDEFVLPSRCHAEWVVEDNVQAQMVVNKIVTFYQSKSTFTFFSEEGTASFISQNS